MYVLAPNAWLQCVVGGIHLWSDHPCWLAPSALLGLTSPSSLHFFFIFFHVERLMKRSLRRSTLQERTRGAAKDACCWKLSPSGVFLTEVTQNVLLIRWHISRSPSSELSVYMHLVKKIPNKVKKCLNLFLEKVNGVSLRWCQLLVNVIVNTSCFTVKAHHCLYMKVHLWWSTCKKWWVTGA